MRFYCPGSVMIIMNKNVIGELSSNSDRVSDVYIVLISLGKDKIHRFALQLERNRQIRFLTLGGKSTNEGKLSNISCILYIVEASAFRKIYSLEKMFKENSLYFSSINFSLYIIIQPNTTISVVNKVIKRWLNFLLVFYMILSLSQVYITERWNNVAQITVIISTVNTILIGQDFCLFKYKYKCKRFKNCN